MRSIELMSVVSISLLLLLASYLLARGRGRNKSFRWIGLFFLLLALNFADGLLYLSGFYLAHPRLAAWEEGFTLLYGPLCRFAFRQYQQGLARHPRRSSTNGFSIPRPAASLRKYPGIHEFTARYGLQEAGS